MTQTILCRCCGQPLPPRERAGIYLSSKKAAIFDFVRQHPGVTVEGIIAQLDDNSTAVCIRQHIFQINSLLAGTEVRISGNERGQFGGYVVVDYPKKYKRRRRNRR